MLHNIIVAELRGIVLTKMTRNTYILLGKAIKTKGGLHEWARSQANYSSVKAKLLQRKYKQIELLKIQDSNES